MSPTRVIRPDLRRPDEFMVQATSEFMGWIQDGLLKKAADLHYSVTAHGDCDMASSIGCVVRQEWMVKTYGSLDKATEAGCKLTDCSEDLAFLLKAQAELMDFIHQYRFLLSNVGSRGLHELTSIDTMLLKVKEEVNHRTEAAKADTGLMPKVEDESLLGLTKKAPTEPKK